MIEEAINFHVIAKCYPTFQPVNGMFAGLLKVPENVLDRLPKLEVLYETNNGNLTIYIDGVKDKIIDIPNYGIRCLILADMICKSDRQGFSGILVRPLDENGKDLEYIQSDFISSKNSVDLINITMSRREKLLDNKLNAAIINMIVFDEAQISEDIEQGFNIIREHYLEEFEKHE